jgi:hypothetical protein
MRCGGNGQDAGACLGVSGAVGLNCEERERVEKALRVYCGQDTLAMVRLLERLKLTAIGRQK